MQPALDAWAAEKVDFLHYDSGSDGPWPAAKAEQRSANAWDHSGRGLPKVELGSEFKIKAEPRCV
jgi:hypothetical protein